MLDLPLPLLSIPGPQLFFRHLYVWKITRCPTWKDYDWSKWDFNFLSNNICAFSKWYVFSSFLPILPLFLPPCSALLPCKIDSLFLPFFLWSLTLSFLVHCGILFYQWVFSIICYFYARTLSPYIIKKTILDQQVQRSVNQS